MFTEYADTADWLVKVFGDAGFTARRYSGADDHTTRDRIREDFQQGRFEVIVSTDAGNEGIDLQAARVLVNWDIPWSLVTLEQRMGRIHRIGQPHRVTLYNLIAKGTREGEAHERLLDRLVEAANELGGRMFDSLNAIMERIESGGCEAMLRLFYDSDRTAATGGEWPTLEQIRVARDEYFAELRETSSTVDPDEANSARHDDLLARVNPIIVERYLNRVSSGGLLECAPALAGDGFFALSARRNEHGWELPAALRPSNGRATVATSGDARRKAIDAGHKPAAGAVVLGPSEPSLTALVDALRERVGPDLWQGATLIDSSAREDYTLFVYECDITEGPDSGDSRHRPRTSTVSWLIAVSADGEARIAAWGTLPNLSADRDCGSAPLALESERAAAADRQATEAAEQERTRRADRLGSWVAEFRDQIKRLPHALTNGIADRHKRIAERKRIQQSVDARIAAAEAAATVKRSKPRRIGWTNVTAAAHDNPHEDSDPDSEAVSMRFVEDRLTGQGWNVSDVHTQGHGYDLHARRGAEQRCVEVKGRAGSADQSGVTLTGGELAKASQLGNDYWLYVVDRCADGAGRLYGAWQNPAATFDGCFADQPIVRLAGSDLKNALDSRGDAP